jgi:hypothetical protein
MFCSLITDLIPREMKCGQCLCELMKKWIIGKCDKWPAFSMVVSGEK